VRLSALLLVTVYLAALAVALRDPSQHLLAGLVVLAALAARFALRPSAARSAVVSTVRPRRSARQEVAAPAVASG
jgi:hypothetical protein